MVARARRVARELAAGR